MKLSKTNYLIFRECGKNAWVKIHKPEIYNSSPLSAFEGGIIETGNEVDELARDLFPGGVLIEKRDDFEYTKELIKNKNPILYQPVFETDKYQIACDIFVYNEQTKKYDVCEVKASNSGEDKKKKDKLYSYDLAFQYIILKKLKIPIGNLYIVRLNQKYSFDSELEIEKLFTKENFSEEVFEIEKVVEEEIKIAYDFLSETKEPNGY